MSIKRELVACSIPLAQMGIDPSSSLGAHALALRVRRYWLERGLEVPVGVHLAVTRFGEPGKARYMPQSVYGVKADFKAARKVRAGDVPHLIEALFAEAETLA